MNQKTAPAAPAPLEREVAFDPQTLAIISKAEIDMQIATAHRFPRVVSVFLGVAEELVTLNEYVADECIYSLPARSGGDNDQPIEGPSARFAEVILHAWKNSRAGARVVGEDGGFIVCQGAFHDLESNTAISYEVRRKITKRGGQRYSDDMIGMTGNAGCAIALRNAILKGIPKAFWIGPYEAARKVLLGDYQTLDKRRAETLDRFKKLGIKPERIYEKYGIKGIDDLTLELVFQLRTMLNAIRDGDTNVDEQFPKAPAATARSASEGLKQHLTGAGAPAGATAAGADAVVKGDAATGTGGTTGGTGGTGFTKTAGTVEKRDEIILALKEATTGDQLDEIIVRADPYEWTKPDLDLINGVYHERAAALA